MIAAHQHADVAADDVETAEALPHLDNDIAGLEGVDGKRRRGGHIRGRDVERTREPADVPARRAFVRRTERPGARVGRDDESRNAVGIHRRGDAACSFGRPRAAL